LHENDTWQHLQRAAGRARRQDFRRLPLQGHDDGDRRQWSLRDAKLPDRRGLSPVRGGSGTGAPAYAQDDAVLERMDAARGGQRAACRAAAAEGRSEAAAADLIGQVVHIYVLLVLRLRAWAK